MQVSKDFLKTTLKIWGRFVGGVQGEERIQCFKMARFVFQYLAIGNNLKLPNSIINFPK